MHPMNPAICEQLSNICLNQHRSAMRQRQQDFSDRLEQLQINLGREIRSIIATLEATSTKNQSI